ncbi:alkylation response protein AidB-like acyl-CoA dehydrogenase [Arthrobacter ginsengisoli]|uniref:Alkylation response protein AidB-like acyl-CoA dehydrogenase n=1 Tax=Arthrobacter ginsengisoli TaxID=1356565 RepID=A0ABU1UIP2_9MICC|nr:acyl-CoA dehydrogenase family protein [Arthrobacter ginsengisoli]MDR7085033.1 alkylation response protein AidB-like acyl-CoA dehydrogenase [Arthrobacter ginsengisoli]
MALSYTSEHEELRGSIRKFLDSETNAAKRHLLADSTGAYDVPQWKTMAQELGLHGMAIPDEYGGSAFGFMEQSVVMEEMGRVVHRSPYFSTVILAATALQLGDDEAARARWLPGIASGDVIGTVALVEADGDWSASTITTKARVEDGGRSLYGAKSFVTDGAAAELIIVLADSDEGEMLLAVDAREPGTAVVDLPVLDQTRPLATVIFNGASGTVLATGARTREILAQLLDVALSALAAEQVGGAARSLEMAVEYAKIREQFGTAIGSFQAIKFKAADMLLQLEAARSAALYAARAVSDDAADRTAAAAVAKAVCSDAYFAIAAESIQIHGGIGFTWEHDAHLYFKRAKASELLFGNADVHRERLAKQLGW